MSASDTALRAKIPARHNRRRFLVIALVLVLLGGGLLGVLQRQALTHFRASVFPYHGTTIYAIGATTVTAITAERGTVRWQAALSGQGHPFVAGDRVIIPFETSTAHGLIALDVTTGERIWTFASAELALVTPVDYRAGMLLLAVEEPALPPLPTTGLLIAVDAHTGQERWRFIDPDGQPARYARSGDTAFIGNLGLGQSFGQRSLHAVDLTNGQERWHYQASSTRFIVPYVGEATVYAQTADVGSDPGTLTALDSATGAVRWTQKVHYDNISPVITAQAVVLVGQGQILALDHRDGHQLWRSGDADTHALQLLGDDILATKSNAVLRYKSQSGAVIWQVSLMPLSATNGIAAIDANRNVLVVDRAAPTTQTPRLRLIDGTTGQLRWQVQGGNNQSASDPVVQGKRVFWATGTTIRALQVSDGAKTWSLDPSEPPLSLLIGQS